MATSDRPRFFCTRPDGTLTPLVAVDELPTDITIRGVSRTLNAGETQGMTSCGLATQRPEPWFVDGVTQSSGGEAGKEPLHDMHSLLLQMITNNNIPEPMRVSAQAILFQGVDRHGLSGDGTPNGGLSPVAPAFFTKNPQMGNKHAPVSKKEYCSYWIRHGECDYSQQGCLYKHEMPVDMVMIEKLGLRDIPRWYREKYNVPSLLHSSQTRPQLAIADQPAMRALPSPASTIDESCGSKVSTINANPKGTKSSPQFTKSPPRGPANRGTHNGFGNHQHRGGRNGVSNGHHGNNWKGTHRGGRNRNTGYVRPTISGERSGECSPGMGSPRAAFDYGTHGFGGNQVCTPATPVTAPATVPITFSATGHAGVPMAPHASHQSLLDDDIFEDRSSKPIEPHRHQPLHLYHGSTPSSDGGVMLPTVSYDSSFGTFGHTELPDRKQSASNSSHSTPRMNFGPSTPRLGDLHITDNMPLNSAETRVTWGPIGGPILKRTSPPTDSIAELFGPYSNIPHSH